MVDLVPWFEAQIKKGHSIERLKEYALKFGHKKEDIDAAIDRLKPVKNKSPVVLTVLIILSIIIIVFIVGIYMMPNMQLNHLDVESSLKSNDAFAGEPLSFKITIANIGNENWYDVNFRYKIIDSDGNIKAIKEEVIAVKKLDVEDANIALPPHLLPGEYKLIVEARYDDKTSESESIFVVKERIVSTTADVTTTSDIVATSLTTISSTTLMY